MQTFIVKTHEAVEGTYEVEAATIEEARGMINNPRIDWGNVRQIDYVAFNCLVTNVTRPDE